MKPTADKLEERPPIVAVLGHVDHGKSTLLDFIRKSNTVEKEAGGITQHIGAYEVEHEQKGEIKRITFIDTPGHAAFSAIRARGAKAADIAILVVAADDGVKAQTLEALQSIRAADIPFIVAINKIDKPNANVERTQSSLSEHEVYLEKLGGDVPWVALSAKTGQGVDELLDLILLVAEVEELKTASEGPARGYVIEAHRDPKRGIAATLIITQGVLSQGMAVVAGSAIAPVRIMENHAGRSLKKASFSSPVLLVGFDDLPDVGEEFIAYKNKKAAEEARGEIRAARAEIRSAFPESSGDRFLLPVVVRADTSGSEEAISHVAGDIGDEYRRIAIVQSGIGAISENDIKAAIAAGNGFVVGFNVGIDLVAEALARQHGIQFETFSIIYKLAERVEDVLRQRAPKREVEQVVGRVQVLKRFSSGKYETTVGGKVIEGFIAKKALVRLMRKGEEIGRGAIGSIQTNKQDADRVDQGGEFGALVEIEVAPAPGDIIESVVKKEV